jgi:hypothetical protein
LECSGEALPAHAALLSISLYDFRSREVIASVNLADRKCVTYAGFTSCDLDPSNSRLTRVRTLINNESLKGVGVNVEEGEEEEEGFGEGGGMWRGGKGVSDPQVRTFGCDVSIFEAGKLSDKVSWSLAVERARKFCLFV